MKLKTWEIALIVALSVLLLTGATLQRTSDALSDKLVRLHVVANSDSEEDQALKLQVRDSVLRVLESRLDGVTDIGEAKRIIEASLPEIERAARETLLERDSKYEVRVTLCEERFPTTDYDNFSLPAGTYTSLRVKIGKAAGHNWWCVVFPPVCAAASMEETAAAAVGLTEDQISLITRDSGGYVVKFRLLELWGKFKAMF